MVATSAAKELIVRYWGVVFVIAVLIAAVAVGIVLIDIPGAVAACSGTIVDTDLCEPARLAKSLSGALLAVGSMITAAILGGALIMRPRGQDEASVEQPAAEEETDDQAL
jgi:hypothetical protein